MRALRLLGWEDIAEDIVNKERARELSWRSFRMYLSGISYWLTSVAGGLSLCPRASRVTLQNLAVSTRLVGLYMSVRALGERTGDV